MLPFPLLPKSSPVRSLVLNNLSLFLFYHRHSSSLHATSPAGPPPSNQILPSTNPFDWNALLKARLEANDPNGAIAGFKKMRTVVVKPNGITFSFVTRAFSTLRESRGLMAIQAQLLRLGFRSDVFALNTLLDGYLACGAVDIARNLFDEMPARDLVAWTVMMNGYLRSDRASEAVELFFVMKKLGVSLDGMALVAVFNACAQVGDLILAKKVESLAFRNGIGIEYDDVHVTNSLLDMYSKCGSIEDARMIFDSAVNKDRVTWNCMITGYARAGNVVVARKLFDQMHNKNDVSWSALISGYVQNGEYMEALRAFQEMKEETHQVVVVPNNAAITGAITACAHLGALCLGREIHSSLDEDDINSDVVLSTALVDMYAKCGYLELSCFLFDRIVRKTLVSWNVMIMAMATHGNASACFHLFSRLLRSGVRPNSETFLGILTGCAHAGWLNQGKNLFIRMTCVYGITPQIEHCSCMVRLIGQAGFLDQAYEFIKVYSFTPDATLWGALLTACCVHGNHKLGEFVAQKIIDLDPFRTGTYVQLSTLYSNTGMWKEAMKIRTKMKQLGIRNRPGWSSFEVDGSVHEFLVGDHSHPLIDEILSVLNWMDIMMTSMLLLPPLIRIENFE